jgi:hypothetical protein
MCLIRTLRNTFLGQLTFLIIAQHPRPQSPLTTSSFSLPLSAPPAAPARQPRIPELRSFLVLCSILSLHFTTYRAPVLYYLLSFRAASLDSRHFAEWHSLVPLALPLSSVFLSGKRRVAGPPSPHPLPVAQWRALHLVSLVCRRFSSSCY